MEGSAFARLFSALPEAAGVGERGPEATWWASFCPLVWLGSRSMGEVYTHPQSQGKSGTRPKVFTPRDAAVASAKYCPCETRKRISPSAYTVFRKWKSRDRPPSFFAPESQLSTPSRQAGASSVYVARRQPVGEDRTSLGAAGPVSSKGAPLRT